VRVGIWVILAMELCLAFLGSVAFLGFLLFGLFLFLSHVEKLAFFLCLFFPLNIVLYRSLEDLRL
jgi:hypothetical protein